MGSEMCIRDRGDTLKIPKACFQLEKSMAGSHHKDLSLTASSPPQDQLFLQNWNPRGANAVSGVRSHTKQRAALEGICPEYVSSRVGYFPSPPPSLLRDKATATCKNYSE